MLTNSKAVGVAALLSVSAFLVTLFAATPSPGACPADDGKFQGADKCKKCHSSKPKGDQYGKWKQMKHAKAFEALAGDEAKKIAKERGIDDPQKSEKCAKCHVAAFGLPAERLDAKFDIKQGVQCEACHGPAEKHVKARLAEEREDDKAIHEDAVKEMPKPDAKTLCATCHNAESPTIEKSIYWDKEKKEFNWEKALKEVEHPNPMWKK